MSKTRTEKLQVTLTPHERAALDHIARKRGIGAGPLLRLEKLQDIVAEYNADTLAASNGSGEAGR